MNNKWDEFQITPSKKFGYEVLTLLHQFTENIEVRYLQPFIQVNIL